MGTLLKAVEIPCWYVSNWLAKDAVALRLIVSETVVLSIGKLLASCGGRSLWDNIWRAQELKAKIILLVDV